MPPKRLLLVFSAVGTSSILFGSVRIRDADDRRLRAGLAPALHLQVRRRQVRRACLLVAVVHRVGVSNARRGRWHRRCAPPARLRSGSAPARRRRRKARNEGPDKAAAEPVTSRRRPAREMDMENPWVKRAGWRWNGFVQALWAAMHARCDDLQPAHPHDDDFSRQTAARPRPVDGRERASEVAGGLPVHAAPAGISRSGNGPAPGKPTRRGASRSNSPTRAKLPSALTV